MAMLNGLFVGVILLRYLVAYPIIANNPTISSYNIGIKLIVSDGAYEKMGNDTLKVRQLLNLYFSQVNQIFGNTNLNDNDPWNKLQHIRLVPCKDNVVHDDIDLNKYNETGVIWEYELIRQRLKYSLLNSKYPMVIYFTNNDIQKKSGQQVYGLSESNIAVISLFAFDPHQMAVSLVFAHEVGHLLSAVHDQFYENCSPSTIDDAYIMNEIQNFRCGPNHMKFSPCSIKEIIHHKHNFLVFSEKNIFNSCGNGIVDQGEECDDSGSCCNATSCRLKPGAKCSPWHSTCCDSYCQVLPKDHICLPADLKYCYNESRCDGISPQCPNYRNLLTDGDTCYICKVYPIQTTTTTTTTTSTTTSSTTSTTTSTTTIVNNSIISSLCLGCKDSCGSGIVDEGEECDDNGPCCNATSCRLKPEAKCSPWHSTCCDSKCQVLPKGEICLPADLKYCYNESRCDGISPQCPYYQNHLSDGDSCYDSKLDENSKSYTY